MAEMKNGQHTSHAPTENNKENATCKENSKEDVASQEEEDYRELTSRHARMRLQLDVGGVIGRGSFGTVHAARWRDARADRPVVVKRVRTAGLAEKARRQVMQEAVLHSQAVHPHICQLVGAYDDRGVVHLVLHACVGDLAGAIAAGVSWLPAAAPWVVRCSPQFEHAQEAATPCARGCERASCC